MYKPINQYRKKKGSQTGANSHWSKLISEQLMNTNITQIS